MSESSSPVSDHYLDPDAQQTPSYRQDEQVTFASNHHSSIPTEDDPTKKQSRPETPQHQVLERHIQSLSGRFQDTMKLSPDDHSISYSPEADEESNKPNGSSS